MMFNFVISMIYPVFHVVFDLKYEGFKFADCVCVICGPSTVLVWQVLWYIITQMIISENFLEWWNDESNIEIPPPPS